jgi:hypothetical protein
MGHDSGYPSLSHHCAFAGLAVDGEVQCSNQLKILNVVTMPEEWCLNDCPYRKQPDYLTASSRLYTLQQSQGVYVPRPRSCGGCGTVKRRQDVTQFVWPYWHAGASGDELRWSIRSVEQHFEGATLCTIVGDRPPWWQGHVIDCPRIGPAPNRGFRDMLNKMRTIATHPEIRPEFVWMMDDVYFLKPVTLEELQQPRAYGWREDASNSWQRRKSNTMRLLREAGLSNHDYATHLPHHAEKQKLADLFERFDLHANTLLWEVLYGNVYRQHPIRPEPFFCRLLHPVEMPELRQRARLASVLNHTANAWCPAIREYLAEILQTPATGEQGPGGYLPTFKKSRRMAGQRVVKRRHPSTWRVNQPAEAQ